MQTRARGKVGEIPLGSGTSHKGCDKGHQGKHADKGKPVEGKGWGVHPGRWPSDTGRQGKRATKGKLVEGEGKGGEPEHKPNAKGREQWKPKSVQTDLG